MKGFDIQVKPSKTLTGSYDVECWPKELQQPYKDGKPQPVPPCPKATVESSHDELVIHWSVFPERFNKDKSELEGSVKDKIREYQSSNQDS